MSAIKGYSLIGSVHLRVNQRGGIMRKIILIICSFLLLNAIAMAYGLPRAQYTDGDNIPDSQYDGIDIMIIDTYPSGIVNITFQGTPDPASCIYHLYLNNKTGWELTGRIIFTEQHATIKGNTLEWDVSTNITELGWTDVYFGVHTQNGSTHDNYPNGGASYITDPDPDLQEGLISVLIVFPILLGIILLSIYDHKKNEPE
ncbi:MAG: hypothetical protein ACFFCQ_14815 [Promethearchaeota archaeon]